MSRRLEAPQIVGEPGEAKERFLAFGAVIERDELHPEPIVVGCGDGLDSTGLDLNEDRAFGFGHFNFAQIAFIQNEVVGRV